MGSFRGMGQGFQARDARCRWRDILHRCNDRPRSPTQRRRKRGDQANAIGKSRGGRTTKIHALVDALGNPVRLSLTVGERHDVTQAPVLIDGLRDCEISGDKAYDSSALIAQMIEANIEPIIPQRKGSIVKRDIDLIKYKGRHLVENFFCRLKQCRRVATRYEKTSESYMAMVVFASILVWLV